MLFAGGDGQGQGKCTSDSVGKETKRTQNISDHNCLRADNHRPLEGKKIQVPRNQNCNSFETQTLTQPQTRSCQVYPWAKTENSRSLCPWTGLALNGRSTKVPGMPEGEAVTYWEVGDGTRCRLFILMELKIQWGHNLWSSQQNLWHKWKPEFGNQRQAPCHTAYECECLSCQFVLNSLVNFWRFK